MGAAVRKGLLNAGEGLKEILAKLGSSVRETAAILVEKVLEKIPEDKKKLMPFGLGGVACLLLILAAVMLAGRAGNGKAAGDLLMTTGPAVPVEDLFLPAEPDFLPEVLLEREPGQPWTAEDAIPYWKDLKDGRENEWRGESGAVIDELMESVP
jgi:hypothetical protein